MITGIIESFITALTSPIDFIKGVVTSIFYWTTRIFGVTVALFQKPKGE